MKQLSSFLALSVNGGDRISFTYDTIDPQTGDVVESNTKESFFVVDDDLRAHVDAIREWIREHRLAE